MGKLIVLAIGGNSLIKDEKHESVPDQYKAVVETAKHIVEFLKQGHKLVITHGNGPQVGFILRRSEIAKKDLHTIPLDSCVADTQGAIGYNIQMALRNEMKRNGIEGNIATIVTQTVVDANDPSMLKPSKPIGFFMNEVEAKIHREEDGWDIVQDSGRGYRRVVPSPFPKKIIEVDVIKSLLKNNMVVIAVGGGGIPVIEDEEGMLSGIEAVIDKDYATALLAKNLNADLLIVSTAVEKVYINFNKPDRKGLDKINVDEVKKYMHEGHFGAGSMLPKIKAIVDFIEATGSKGIITDPKNINLAISGKAGTTIVP